MLLVFLICQLVSTAISIRSLAKNLTFLLNYILIIPYFILKTLTSLNKPKFYQKTENIKKLAQFIKAKVKKLIIFKKLDFAKDNKFF